MTQYPPIEAAVIGLPVVFYANSLLGSLLDGSTTGAVADDAEGRRVAELLLEGDATTIQAITRDQQRIATVFSEAWCEQVWAEHLSSSGIAEAISRGPAIEDLRDFDVNDPTRFVAPELLLSPGEPLDLADISEGVRFDNVNLPHALAGTHGLGDAEHWGRWAMGEVAVLKLETAVSGTVEIEIRGGSIEMNWRRPFDVELGGARGSIELSNWIDPPRSARLHLDVTSPAQVIRITAPEAIVSDGERILSFGISRVRVRPKPSLAYRSGRSALEAGERLLRRVARALKIRRLINLLTRRPR